MSSTTATITKKKMSSLCFEKVGCSSVKLRQQQQCHNCYLERLTKLSLSLGSMSDDHQPCFCNRKRKGKMQQQSNKNFSSTSVEVSGSRKSAIRSDTDITTSDDEEVKLFGVLIGKINRLKQQQGSSSFSSSNGHVGSSKKRNMSQASASCSTTGHAAAADLPHLKKQKHMEDYIDVAPLAVRPPAPPELREENNATADRFPIKKKLTRSDVNGLSRLLLPSKLVKSCIKRFLSDGQKQDVKSEQGLKVLVKDLDDDSLHYLTFKKVKSTRCYILNKNWNKKFVERRELCADDTIGMFWDPINYGFVFSVLERAPAPVPVFSSLPLVVYRQCI